MVVCPPFTDLRTLQTLIEADKLTIGLGAQNCYFEDQGAFTGEVSPQMLAKLMVEYVILGHSERRQLFGETDEIGEQEAQGGAEARHDADRVRGGDARGARSRCDRGERVTAQTNGAFAGVKAADAATCVVAYEPIWAIGTGRNATPEDANETVRRHPRRAARRSTTTTPPTRSASSTAAA